MYGLIHRALRDMIVDQHGYDTWMEISDASGVTSDAFLTMRPYDDEIAMSLAIAAASILEQPIEELWDSFGFYWITQFAPREYHRLMNLAGDNPIEFLQNLDDMHDRISTSFIHFLPPSFRVSFSTSNSAIVTYSSSRTGLTHFVLGMLKGLGPRFGVDMSINWVAPQENAIGEACDIGISFGNANA